jgi:hypothetical protein
MSSSRRPPRAAKSGEHPAVRGYRDKLASVANLPAQKLSELDKELTEYLAAVRTPIPPPGAQDDDELTPTKPL